MKSGSTFRISVLLMLMLCCKFIVVAQNIIPPPPAADTVRVIQIIQGKSLREKTIDSLTSIQTIAGDVILKEGLTLFYCDSASINKRTNILEAFGHIHINQNDSIHTYSQYLKYIGKERIAFLSKEVKLTDNKGTLFTQDLEYDLKSSIGKYSNGGRVVNGKTVLTSTEGVYYADTKDVFFKKNVHLVDPKYDVRNDTLLYNTQTQITSWNTPTIIKSKDGGDVYSSNGTYDLKNGKAFFGNRTVIKDSTRTYVADKIAIDDSTGKAQLEGNAVIRDSANGYSVLGNQIYIDKTNGSFLATRKPVLIFKGEGNDSTFIAADTLFSGVEKRDSLGRKIIVSQDTLKKETVVSPEDSLLAKSERKDSGFIVAHTHLPQLEKRDSLGRKITALKDTLNKETIVNLQDSLLPKVERKDSFENKTLVKTEQLKDSVISNLPDNLIVKNDWLRGEKPVENKPAGDTAINSKTGSLPVKQDVKDSIRGKTITKGPVPKDSLVNKPKVQNRPAGDSVFSSSADSLPASQIIADSTAGKTISKNLLSQKDGLNDTAAIHVSRDTAIRYFLAFHSVRIFNDSLQSVCDSLYYSSEDSIFRLFQNPLVFSNNSQIAGDTIYMYTKNKKAERLYVFENGIIINKTNEKMYNQIAGRTLNGYFKNGELDYMRAKGSPAESVYYPQDDDSAFIGMNRSKGDVIDIFFLNKEVHKIKFINDVDGTLFPMHQIPEDQKFLKNYKWEDKRRPKNKLELFE
ncbi:MAG: OstA-like protein [Ferruginibacter sp.]